ncbi:MAG: BlaR1 family beta-lactam sensor/signal transducer [Ruminococcus sp.]|jgi:bla regulator protein BlaR1
MTAFMIRFFAGNILSALLIGAILLMKKIFSEKISAKYHRRIWFILLLFLGILLLPNSFFLGLSLPFAAPSGLTAASVAERDASLQVIPSANWMNDFSQSVSRADLSLLTYLFLGIWTAGMVIRLFLFFRAEGKILFLKRSGKIPDQELTALFHQCKKELGIRRNISFLESNQILSPLAAGLFHPTILIPPNLNEHLSSMENRHILLHELSHIRHRDLYINFILCFFQVVYWFHPMVFLAFRRIRLDEEIYCDHRVMEMCRESEVLNYGYTLLHFAEKMSAPSFPASSYASPSKKQLKVRFQRIAEFSLASKKTNRLSRLLFLAVTLLALFMLPLLVFAGSGNDRYSPEAPLPFREMDLSSYFGDTEGCFVLSAPTKEEYLIYNEEMSLTRFSPNSTYKICAALHALESQVITPDRQVRKWNGQDYGFSAWNRDQDLHSAMENSVNWYFQEMDREMGMEAIKNFLSQIQYGNCSLSSNTDDFWLESTLQISPLEQVILLRHLYDNTWKFDEKNIELLKNALYLEENDLGALYGKTGTGKVNGKEVSGWFIGWLETEKGTSFFAVYLKGKDHVSGTKAAEAGMRILETFRQ